MRLKSLSTYQSVNFERGSRTWFSSDVQGLESLVMELKDNYVIIKSDKDEVLVFATNICYCRPLTDLTKKLDTSAEPRVHDKKSRGL